MVFLFIMTYFRLNKYTWVIYIEIQHYCQFSFLLNILKLSFSFFLCSALAINHSFSSINAFSWVSWETLFLSSALAINHCFASINAFSWVCWETLFLSSALAIDHSFSSVNAFCWVSGETSGLKLDKGILFLLDQRFSVNVFTEWSFFAIFAWDSSCCSIN